MLFLCLVNLAPTFLLAAMGMAGTATIDADAKYNLPRALLIGLTVLGLPLAITQFFVRGGSVVAILIGIVLGVLLPTLLVWLVAGVFASSFEVLFKVMATALSLVGICLYGWGLRLLMKAIPEARSRRLKSRP